MTFHADDFETQVSCAKRLKDILGEYSSFVPILWSFSVSTRRFDSIFVPSNKSVSLNLFTFLRIVSLYGTVTP